MSTPRPISGLCATRFTCTATSKPNTLRTTEGISTDAALVKSCLWLFGGLYFGIECDDSFTQISGDGFTWGTGTPDPNNGHCVVGAGATPSGVLINTWGMIGTFTWAAVAQFCADSAGGNLFAILSRELIASAQAKAPSGFAFAALVADFDGLGGAIAASA